MTTLLAATAGVGAWYCYLRLCAGKYDTGWAGIRLLLGMIFGISISITLFFG